MNWIESKWSWYKALPWYWKVLASVLGLGIILLLILSFIGGKKTLVDSSESDEAHTNLVDHMIEEKIQIDEDLKKEIEASKLKIEEVVKEENLVDEKADEVRDQIDKATSVDEVRQILKGLSQ